MAKSQNIAEGFERDTDKDFKYFLYISKASTAEVRSQLYLALDLNYINDEQFENLIAKTIEISKLLTGFIKYLKN